VLVATNQMRREAAKRKLASQQQRRAERARRRQRVAIITSAAVVVVVVVGVVVLSTIGSGSGETPPAAAPPAVPAAGTCTFTPTPNEPASRPAPVPTVTTASTDGTVAANLQTDHGAIPLTLDRATGPCAVESFVSLINAGFYNGTPCHRLTTANTLHVLQCGDPTGTGTGGPGYTVNDEPPTTLAPAGNGSSVIYPRGTVAMARTQQPNSTGSQFFLVYADSTLAPSYTVVGTIGDTGLAALDAIAQAGTDNSSGQGDGAPNTPVTIQTATVG
jgi:peptidyl-prolyl cis-trans isomerase B (cyclophilin B)